MRSHSENVKPSSMAIDLHCLSVKQAKEYVSKTFQEAQEKQADSLTVVTGIGNHVNKNGTRGVLFKKLPEWLKEDPKLSSMVREVKQDKGAYEIHFTFGDNTKAKIEKFNQEMQSLLKTTSSEKLFSDMENKAKLGDISSLATLGSMLVNGIIFPQDIDRGLAYLMKAAETEVTVQTQLGAIFSSIDFPRQDYNQARKWYLKAAEKNDPEALFSLGKMFWLGRGVIKNDTAAIDYLMRSADLGHDGAAKSLADIFFEGVDSIKKDLISSAKYYAVAAKGGVTQAQLMLAKQYFFGWGIDKNPEQAFFWFNKAAEDKDPVATYYVARCYEIGCHVSMDRVKTAVWYKKAALLGDPDARFYVAYSHLIGEFYQQNTSEAIKLFTQLANENHANSAFMLGSTLLMSGPYQDVSHAKSALEKAGELGQLDAQKLLANLYLEENNEKKAFYWFKKAAKEKDVDSLFSLVLLSDKKTLKVSAKEWTNSLQELAGLNNAEAQMYLGRVYLKGCNSLAKNHKKGFKWLAKAASQGNVEAMTGLGFCYLNGMGAKESREQAKSYFKMAAAKGDKIARRNLIFLLHSKEGIFSEEEIHWLELAANDDEADFQCLLGRAYLCTENNKDYFQQGIYWLYRAALNNNETALNFFRQSELDRHGIGARMMLAMEYKRRHGSDIFPELVIWQQKKNKATPLTDEKLDSVGEVNSTHSSTAGVFTQLMLQPTIKSSKSEKSDTQINSRASMPSQTIFSPDMIDPHNYSPDQASSSVNHCTAAASHSIARGHLEKCQELVNSKTVNVTPKI